MWIYFISRRPNFVFAVKLKRLPFFNADFRVSLAFNKYAFSLLLSPSLLYPKPNKLNKEGSLFISFLD